MDPYTYGGGDAGYSVEHTSAPYTYTPPSAPPPPPSTSVATAAASHPMGPERIYHPAPAQDATVQRPHGTDSPTVVKTPPAKNLDIESAIAQTVTDFIDESKDFGTSLLKGIRRYIVPFATVMDLTSAVLRFLTLSFLLLLPDLYKNIFTPPPALPHQFPYMWVLHYVILITSVLGIAVGVPVALFSAVYSLVSLFARRESVYTMTIRKARNERMKYFKQKIRAAWMYIIVAFAAGAFISIPYFTSQDPSFPAATRQILSEISFIVVPLICTIVTMITEREVRMDVVEGGSRMGIGLGMYTAFEAGKRLAHGIGSHVDAAAIRNAMNGDIGGAIESGVAETPGEIYLTLADIAEMLGRSPAKEDPFRRTLNNIVGAAYRSGKYGVEKHPIKGYLTPEKHFAVLFKKYTYNRPSNVPNNITALKTVKTTATIEREGQEGVFVRLWHALAGAPKQTTTTTVQAPDKEQKIS